MSSVGDPTSIPLPSVAPDTDYQATCAVEAYVGMGVCMGVGLIFILLRLYVKLAITHQWGWDDSERYTKRTDSMLIETVACVVGYVHPSLTNIWLSLI